jgi:tRNA A-37 threonylcarbamoyl transferase component Bud32
MLYFLWSYLFKFINYFFKNENNYIYKSLNNYTNKSLVKCDDASKTYRTYTKFVSTHFDTDKINVYENEKKWLQNIKDSDYFPTLLYYDDYLRMIVTTDMGRKMTNADLKRINVKNKCTELITELKKYNCRHNDIKPSELVFQNGRIHLIDFGWAHELDQLNPSYWPECLGDKFKCVPYDDLGSIQKSIDFIKQRKKRR